MESQDGGFHELIIGTYTDHLVNVNRKVSGTLACRYDGSAIGPVHLLARTRNPSFLVLCADGCHLYAVNETVTFEGVPGGGVSAFARNPSTGELCFLNARPSGGVSPCHLEVAPGGHYLLVANYSTGSVAIFAVEQDGSLGAMTDQVQHKGASVHPVRQTGPHTHMVVFDPSNGDLLVPDLGLDLVRAYKLTPFGTLVEGAAKDIPMAPGAGPRHLAFHPDGRHLFLVNELNNTLVALRRQGERFGLVTVESTLPVGFNRRSHAGAVRVSPSGRWVIVSNRSLDAGSMAVFRFDVEHGSLNLNHVQSTVGREPRDLVFTNNGTRVVVANQGSDTLVVFTFDEDTSHLERVSTVSVPAPVCLRVL